jgi:UDP-glucose 4-epimerase
MKRAIVTGGLGFIGSHLVEELVEKGYHVIVIDNLATGRRENVASVLSKIEVIENSLDSQEVLEKIFQEGDLVFHLAALADIVPSIENPDKYFNANVVGTYNVVRAAVEKKVKKLIYAASSSCYGIPDTYPTLETEVIDPKYPYALTKYLGETICKHWADVYKLPVISTRFFNVYGPRARTKGSYGAVFGVFIAQYINNAPLTIVGDGSQKRDFTYVTDVSRGLVLAGESNVTSGIYNLSSGNPVSVKYIADLIGPNQIFIPKRPGEPDITHGNNTKFKETFNWEPNVSIEEGVKKLLADISWAKDAPVWTPESISKATEAWFKYLS